MRIACMRKSVAVHRRLRCGPSGVRKLETRNVKNTPRRKTIIEISVVSQTCGLEGRPAVERPRITVLPSFYIS